MATSSPAPPKGTHGALLPTPPHVTKEFVTKRLTERHGSLFYKAPDAVIERLLLVGSLNTLAKGSAVFKEGDVSEFVYLLIDGAVQIKLGDMDLRIMHPGDIGGMTSSIPETSVEKMSRSSSHLVVSDCATILALSHENYQSLLDHPDFAHSVVRYLQLRVREKTHIIELLKGQRAESAAKEDLVYRIAVFDTKPYDKKYLGKVFEASPTIEGLTLDVKFIDSKLTESTGLLATGCQAVCIFVNDTCDSRVLSVLKAAGVKAILLRCAGFNNVDIHQAFEFGMPVLRVPSYSPNAVAEHAFALLATVNRRTARAYGRVRDGNFALSGLEGRDLAGLTCGVAGVGKIGKCFVNIAKGCGMKVVVWDAFIDKKWAAETGVEVVDKLGDLFSRSDVLSLHVPLTAETTHIVNAKTIALMPKGAIIINTSRGPIIEAPALLEALVSGHLGGAGLDVYEGEGPYFFEDRACQPIADGVLARLVNMPNVVVTSHQAFLTDKALTAIGETTLFNTQQLIKSKVGAVKDLKSRQTAMAKLENVVLPPPKNAGKL